jgi:hypothetical protein
MKVIVHRQLAGGQYIVRLAVSDFTPEEVAKMNSFGIPTIQMRNQGGGMNKLLGVPLTQVNPNVVATFLTEQLANEYQEEVLNQIRQAMASLRGRKDDFSSTNEVVI